MEQSIYKWDNPAATNPPDIVKWWGSKSCDSGPKNRINDDVRLALRQKGVNADWLTTGQMQYAEMDHYFDRDLDDEYHMGSADTFMTPVGHTKQRRLELSEEEPPVGQRKPRSWVQMENMRRQANETTLSLAM